MPRPRLLCMGLFSIFLSGATIVPGLGSGGVACGPAWPTLNKWPPAVAGLCTLPARRGIAEYPSRRTAGRISAYCQPGMPFMSGRWCAIPLWQSMQVFSLVNRKR